jgi:hypothetical protein
MKSKIDELKLILRSKISETSLGALMISRRVTNLELL